MSEEKKIQKPRDKFSYDDDLKPTKKKKSTPIKPTPKKKKRK